MSRTRTLEQQLTAAPPEDDLRALAEGLADDDAGVREDCAQRLAAARNAEAGPFLRHALDDDEEQVRVWGAYGLGLLARDEDQAELSRAMREDESPLVRLWATFGCAHGGDARAATALVEMLDLPDLELRSNAVDALITLEDPSVIRPLLDRRLESTDERRKVWASPILHRLGHRDAFGIWRDGLLNPRTRVHAALVSPYLQSLEAARELVRVAAELSQEELDAPVPAANDLPVAELLTAPLLELGLDELLQQGQSDEALRADLLLVVLRTPLGDPEVVAQIFDFAAAQKPEALGKDLAEVLLEQSPPERLRLLARTVDFAPEAVMPALEHFEGEQRDALFDLLATEAAGANALNAILSPLLDLLRASPWAEQFADLPESPWAAFSYLEDGGDEEGDEDGAELDDEARAELESLEDEEDLSPVIERMAAGEEVSEEEREKAEALLADLGMSAEDFAVALNAEVEDMEPVEPPEAADVARRALCVGAVLQRAETERGLAAGSVSAAEAKKAAKALRAWITAEGLDDSLTPMEGDLLDAEPGDWTEEDVAVAQESAEALAILTWSASGGKKPPPSPDKPMAPDLVTDGLPLQAKTSTFLAQAALVHPEKLDVARELYETLLWRAEQEDLARRTLAGEDVELELDLEAVVEELIEDGMDPSIAQTQGRPFLLAEGVRLLGRRAAQRLSEDGALALQAGDFGFRGKPVAKLDDASLRQLLGLAEQRFRALVWLASGGDWDGLSMRGEGG